MLAVMFGGLVPTFLLSLLFLWITRTSSGGLARLAVVHAFSWLIAAFAAGIGMADGGAFAGIATAGLYAPPQIVWLIVDLVRLRRRERKGGQGAAQ